MPSMHAPSAACHGFLRFTSGVTPADPEEQHGSRVFLIHILVYALQEFGFKYYSFEFNFGETETENSADFTNSGNRWI